MVTQDQREGLRVLVTAIGEAFERAKTRKTSKGECVADKMLGKRLINADMALVKKLMGMDKKKELLDPLFTPGQWYTDTDKWEHGANDHTRFGMLVRRMENQVEGFKFASWRVEKTVDGGERSSGV